GVYGGDPAPLRVGRVLPRFLEMEKKYGSLVRGVLASKKDGRPKRGGGGGAGGVVAGLDARLGEVLGAIDYSSSVTLSLIYRGADFDGKRAGFGFLVPQKERQRLAACTFVGTKFSYRVPDDRIVLRCFFGGINDGAVLEESDESL